MRQSRAGLFYTNDRLFLIQSRYFYLTLDAIRPLEYEYLMKASTVPVRVLSTTALTLFLERESRSEVCRAAICALHLTDEKDAPLPPSEIVRAASWTTVSLDQPSTLLFQHLTKERGYRNLSVILSTATYGKETFALTREILDLSPEERRDFYTLTAKKAGLLPEDAVPRLPKDAAAREEKRLRETQIGVLKFLSKFGKHLASDTKNALEREASALQERLTLLRASTS